MGLLAKEIGSNQIKSLTNRKLLMKFVIKEKLEYMKGIIKAINCTRADNAATK
jgi:hypothetical protein